MKRKVFIKQFSAALAGTFLLPKFMQSNMQVPPMPSPALPDADYWKAIRGQFPLTDKRVYFNNGTIGPNPFAVLRKVEEELRDKAFTGEYGDWEDARKALAPFTGVTEEEIALTHNTTEGINIAAWGFPMQKGDEVIMTTHEHAGNALPWLNRARLEGIVVKVFQPAPTAAGNLQHISDLINRRTRVIAVPHILCTTGQVMPVKEIAALGKSKGLFVFFDGAHGPGSTVLDFKEIGCDAYAACTHKWLLGPHGTGFLYVKKDMQDTVQTRFIGAHSDKGWDLQVNPPLFSGYADNSHRYDYGSQNAPLYKGVAAAVGFHKEIGPAKVEARTRELGAYLQKQLLELPEIEMLSPTEPVSRGPMIAFRHRKVAYQPLTDILAKAGFRIRQLPEANLNAIRISTHIYNQEHEADALVSALKEVK